MCNLRTYVLIGIILSLLFTGLVSAEKNSDPEQLTYTQPDWQSFREKQDETFANLKKPTHPPEDYQGNPIDWFLQNWYEEHDVNPGEVSEDAVFLRRVCLDVIGLLPTSDELRGFVKDESPGKRVDLINRLLANRQAYAEHWMSFWNDLLRNDEQTNIDGLREPITQWLYSSLLSNKPYDRMVKEVLNPAPEGPEGFLKGVNWRGRINASQRPVIQAAQTVGQVFLATPLKCASCHDHFTKKWKLSDTYGLAACFSEEAKLELYRCDKPLNETTQAQFPFEGLGTIDVNEDLYTRRGQAANLVVSPKNPRFAHTIVNRLFHKLMGEGLFEPVDDLDYSPTFPKLLDWLAYDFMAHDYNLKHTLRLIMQSKAYQRKAKPAEQNYSPIPTYDAPRIRRMASEQFLDGIYQVTGYSPKVKTMNVAVHNPIIRAWRHKTPSMLATALGRPKREQVTTVREHQATVLQMLEMVNGEDLAKLMRDASEFMLESNPYLAKQPQRLIDMLFLRAYGREPDNKEKALFQEMLTEDEETKKIEQSDLEDVLWMVFMSPEFQYIH